MIYLATVYTSHPRGLLVAFNEACTLAAHYMRRGFPVFSPIAYGHPLEPQIGVPQGGGHDFWMPLDLDYLTHSSELWVTMQENWHISRGIRMEIEHAERLGLPISYLDPQPIFRYEEDRIRQERNTS